MQVLRPEPRPGRSDSISLGWDPGTCIFYQVLLDIWLQLAQHHLSKRVQAVTANPRSPLPTPPMASIQSKQSLSPWSTVGLTSPFMPRLVPPVPAQLSELEAWRPTF